MHVLISLLEATSVFLVVSWVYCSSPLLAALRAPRPTVGKVASIYVFFTGVSIMGTYLGIPIQHGDAIANTRAVGSVLAGLLGGPALGLSVGLTAGLQRMTLGGSAALPGAIATALEGLAAGLVRRALRGRPDRLMTWQTSGLVTLVGEVLHQLLVLAMAGPDSAEIVRVIWVPMVAANTLGAAAFMVVYQNRLDEQDRIAGSAAAQALRIAERTLGLMGRGLGPELAAGMARIVREEAGVGAVAITDREKVLAFEGLGADHHLPGSDLASPWTRQALETGRVTVADGATDPYACRLSASCPLASVVVVPLTADGQVVGTVQLFEAARRRLPGAHHRLGEGIGALLSSQLLVGRYQEQKTLLLQSELRLLRAQVDPHFLFNALNTIVAVTRTDPARARELLVHLARFFRENLKPAHDVSTLAEELAHVGAYLELEKARFPDRLEVETEVDPALLSLRVPTFTLQPLVENAFRHGLAASPNPGRATIRARREGEEVRIEVEDDAGAYVERPEGERGLGMRIVDRRIKVLLGERWGLSVECEPQRWTRVTVRLPAGGVGG